ncbi:hypothetical protein FA15DRAFT_672701 [Coprinopsis marcescibilis]|uniref:Uncharacterized protein n=1 Tax=Coprinopsis marcescibilis TaxID=230819 RepID=A0A5C3KLW0_COPMA|nr:hypothetical protein FA15DRAFT_672701 [Coprinopsis marcescibilis]
MPRTTSLKRVAKAISAQTQDKSDTENTNPRDSRNPRQRTGSFLSVDTVGSGCHNPSSKLWALSERLNRLQGSNNTHKSTAGDNGGPIPVAFSVPPPLTFNRPATTRIPVKPKTKRGPPVKKELRKLSAKTPPLSDSIISRVHAGHQKDDSVVNCKFDINSLPSIPSPPGSPPTRPLNPPSKLPDSAELLAEIFSANLDQARQAPSTSSSVAFPTDNDDRLSTSSSSTSLVGYPSLHRKPVRNPWNDPGERFHLEGIASESWSAKADKWGCVHLSASDCQLFVSFPDTPHYEAWDMSDDAIIACPASLHIMARDTHLWENAPLAAPDVALINIECRTKATSSRFSDHHRGSDQWTCHFEGLEVLSSSNDEYSPALQPDSLSIENKWTRVYAKPIIGKGCRENIPPGTFEGTPPPPPPMRLSSTTSLASLLYSTISSSREELGPTQVHAPSGRGWVMRFWIPVPTYLFIKKETRVFEISAKVWLAPNLSDNVLYRATAADVMDMGSDFVEGKTEMTVSHLRSEREMA